MQLAQKEKVNAYFEEISLTFDSYYKDQASASNPIAKLGHTVFRRPGLVRRFEATFDFLDLLENKKILDVGCGPGVYTIEIARRRGRATGVDIAPAMIQVAKANADRAECADLCEFINMDLWDLQPEEPRYDAVIAIGVFDYIHPKEHQKTLEKLLALTKKELIASFPKKWTPGAFFRAMWFMTKRVDVFFVTRVHIAGLIENSHLDLIFRDCGPIWTVCFRKR